MFSILLLSLLLIGDARGLWDDGRDISDGNLGFFVRTLTCNDAGTVCVSCFNTTTYDAAYVYVFEYVTEPAKFQVTLLGGMWNYKFQYIQGNPSESFRYCDNVNSVEDIGPVGPGRLDLKVIVCLDNYFSDISLPATCTKPVALVSLDDRLDDRRYQGQQILYCLSQ